jgi:heme exporter protein A
VEVREHVPQAGSSRVEGVEPLLDVHAHSGGVRGDRLLFQDPGLALGPGSLLQVTGPNGAGKTRLLRILAGLAQAETGDVCWYGERIGAQYTRYAQSRLYIGHLGAVSAALTPFEHLRHALHLAGEDADSRVLLDALAEMDLAGLEYTPAHALSEGQRRRTALARLLVSRAAVWLLDEPMSALDAEGRRRVEDALASHCSRGGLAVFTTHQATHLDLFPGIGHLEMGETHVPAA